MTINTFFYFSDDVMCPVWSFFIYKEHLNPKSDNFFQRPKIRPKNNVWYDVSPLGHNSLGKMVPDICEKAGILKKNTLIIPSVQRQFTFLTRLNLRVGTLCQLQDTKVNPL